MKKTYCDKCGNEFESFVFQQKDDEAYITVGEFETKEPGKEYEVIRTTHVHVELSARSCGGKPHDLCKPCLLAIISEALCPSPPMALMHRCGECHLEWRPLPKVTDDRCPRCGSFMFESFGRPEAECPAVGCFFPEEK